MAVATSVTRVTECLPVHLRTLLIETACRSVGVPRPTLMRPSQTVFLRSAISKPHKPTWKDLADALGFDARTLRNWKGKRGAPQRPDPVAWAAFVEANGLGDASSILSRLRVARLKEVGLRCEKLRQEIDIASKKAVSVTAVSAMLGRLATLLRSQLYNGIESELPPKLDGLSAAQIRPILRQFADSVCETMRDANPQCE